MFGYKLVKEEELAAEARERAQEMNELTFLRGRAKKFDHELDDLRKLAGEKGRALEMQNEHIKDLREGLQESSKRQREMSARAAFAEEMVRLQATSIEQHMASNERMVKLVADMRRTGFGILEPIEVNETPTTIAQADREAVEENPEFGADDDL